MGDEIEKKSPSILSTPKTDSTTLSEKMTVRFETKIREKLILENISELHHQIEDLQNNNVSLEEEMSLKDEDIHQLRLEQEELLEEIERKI